MGYGPPANDSFNKYHPLKAATIRVLQLTTKYAFSTLIT